MAAQMLPNQMQKTWQTPPFNPQGGGPQGGRFMQQPQTLRSQMPQQIQPQQQFEMMGGQKVPILNSQPQVQRNWRDELEGEDFNTGGFNRFQNPTTINDPNVAIGPQPQQLDPSQAPLQPLEGEFIPSSMPDVPFDMQAPEGQYGLAGAEDALSRMLAGQAGALTEGAYDAFGTMQRGTDQARGDISGSFGTGLRLAQEGVSRARGDIEGQLTSGLSALRQGIDTGRGDIRTSSEGAISRFDPYSQTGQSALDIEAARSGALGPEAQAQAFADYQASPGQEWARKQQEQALIRNAAATGGTQSGNVLTALQEQAAGRSSQNYQQDLQNLRSLAERGQQATGSQAGIQTQAGRDLAQMAMTGGQSELSARQAAGSQLGQMEFGAGQSGQQAAMQSGQQLAQLAQQTGMSQAQLQQMLGQNLSNVYGGAGTNVASLRSQAGRDIASQLNLSGQQLSQLQSDQGMNLANLDQQTIANLANLSAQQGQQTSGLRTGLAALLANLATGSGSQQANLALQMGNAQAGGVTNPWGNTASTLTGLIASNPQLISQMLPTYAPSQPTPPPAAVS